MLKIRTHTQRGFSLVELSVTLLITGVIVGGAITALSAYWQNQLKDRQNQRMTRVQEAIGAYVYNYERYPCPARQNATPSDADYGLEKCAGPATAGTCTDGICTQRGVRGGTGSMDNPVWRGMLPFKTLGISEDYAYDVYGSRFIYAATKAMTVAYDNTDTDCTDKHECFELGNGAIQVKKFDRSRSVPVEVDAVSPPGTAHFILISVGKNRAGGLNQNGVEVKPCSDLDTTSSEYKICNVQQDARYYAHDFDGANNNARDATPSPLFDDKVIYFASNDPNAWSAGKNVTVKAENLGLGSTNPQYDLDVAGDIRIQGDVITPAICGEDDSSCFNPDAVNTATFDCDDPNTALNELPNAWDQDTFDDSKSDYCKSPSKSFDCGRNADGTPRVLIGFQDSAAICARKDGNCDGIRETLCPGTSNPVVYDSVGRIIDNGETDPSQAIQAGLSARYLYQCETGVLKKILVSGSCT